MIAMSLMNMFCNARISSQDKQSPDQYSYNHRARRLAKPLTYMLGHKTYLPWPGSARNRPELQMHLKCPQLQQ